MPLFQFPREHVIDAPNLSLATRQSVVSGLTLEGTPRGPSGPFSAIPTLTEAAGVAEVQDLKDQFVLFQLNDRPDGPAVLEPSAVEPRISGSLDDPDMLVGMEMLSFHVGENEDIEKNTRATLRITFGKDENSTDKIFDTVFWSVAAGLQLYDQARSGRAMPKDLKGDFSRAFGRRPIEIPGSLGKLSFEVVKHREPRWWQRIFSFAESATGKALVSALGFPAITYPAIQLLDELLNRLQDARPEILFQSMPLRLALSTWARDNFGPGGRVRVGCLNPGFCILARGRDYQAILDSDATYNATYSKLVPSSAGDLDLLTGRYDDPFRDMTYAVFRIGMRSTKLDPTFQFG